MFQAAKAIERRLRPIFERRGGYSPEAAETVSKFLLAIQEHGAGNALMGCLLLKMKLSDVRKMWGCLVGDPKAELPKSVRAPSVAFNLLSEPTGDDEMDLLLLELDYGCRSGTGGFGGEAARKWAEEKLAERKAGK